MIFVILVFNANLKFRYMRLSMNQPYLFPYIGYFQLINAADKFVFYDDVNFIKNGWINRNLILINGNEQYFIIPLIKASQNKLINEIEFVDIRPKLLKTIYNAYRKAPHFREVWPLIEDVFDLPTSLISELAIKSVTEVSNYLEIPVNFEKASVHYPETRIYRKAERIFKICEKNNARVYINAIGGINLYSKEQFKERGIDLYFIKSEKLDYNHFDYLANSCLSIIDVLMFNDKAKIIQFLTNYQLI